MACCGQSHFVNRAAGRIQIWLMGSVVVYSSWRVKLKRHCLSQLLCPATPNEPYQVHYSRACFTSHNSLNTYQHNLQKCPQIEEFGVYTYKKHKNTVHLAPMCMKGYSRWWRWFEPRWRWRGMGREPSHIPSAHTSRSALWAGQCRSRCRRSSGQLRGSEAATGNAAVEDSQ